MTLGEAVVAVLWLGVLGNSFVNRFFNIEALDLGGSDLSILINTKLLLKLLKDVIVGITLILSPGPWLLSFLFQILDLPECPLDIHDI